MEAQRSSLTPQARIEYWHVELDQHDVVLAEVAGSESYRDTRNRTAFTNGGAFVEAYPDLSTRHWTETCVPLVMQGAALRRATAALRERALEVGYSITADVVLHVVADGERMDPVMLQENCYAFYLPAGCVELALCARAFVPTCVDPTSHDTCELGVYMGRVQIDGEDLGLADDENYAHGWYDLEVYADGRRYRWSQERARLPAGARLVMVNVVLPSLCWDRLVTAALHLRSIDGIRA